MLSKVAPQKRTSNIDVLSLKSNVGDNLTCQKATNGYNLFYNIHKQFHPSSPLVCLKFQANRDNRCLRKIFCNLVITIILIDDSVQKSMQRCHLLSYGNSKAS